VVELFERGTIEGGTGGRSLKERKMVRRKSRLKEEGRKELTRRNRTDTMIPREKD